MCHHGDAFLSAVISLLKCPCRDVVIFCGYPQKGGETGEEGDKEPSMLYILIVGRATAEMSPTNSPR